MITTSQDFSQAAVATTRKPKARVTITWIDSTIDPTISVSANEQAYPDFSSQLADNVEGTTKKWFAIDEVTPLSETTFIMPDPTPENKLTYQVGWRGSQGCLLDGTFPGANPTATVTFAARPIRGFVVAGDNSWGQYPVDFTVTFFEGVIFRGSVSVSGNNKMFFSTSVSDSIGDLSAITSMQIEILKWSGNYGGVKISEFYSTITEVYEGDKIIEMSVLEESDYENGSLPIGNISSNEIDIKLENADKLLSPDNPNSDLSLLIKPRRRIFAELGFDIGGSVEYVPMGTYWCNDWDVPENEVYASTTGNDRIDRLNYTQYRTSPLFENQTMYDIAEAVLFDAKLVMPDLQYSIHSNLQSVVVPFAFFEPQSHAEALKKIAVATLSFVYADRNGVVRIEPQCIA